MEFGCSVYNTHGFKKGFNPDSEPPLINDFMWFLNKVVDTTGNYMTFSYLIEGCLQLETIEWGGNEIQALPINLKFL